MGGPVRAGSDPEVARALGLAVAVEQHLLPRLGIDRAAAEHRVLAAGLVALVVGEGPVGARHRAVVLLDARLHLLEELLLQGLRRRHHRFGVGRSEEPTSELQSIMRNSYAVFCLKKK